MKSNVLSDRHEISLLLWRKFNQINELTSFPYQWNLEFGSLFDLFKRKDKNSSKVIKVWWRMPEVSFVEKIFFYGSITRSTSNWESLDLIFVKHCMVNLLNRPRYHKLLCVDWNRCTWHNIVTQLLKHFNTFMRKVSVI